MLDQIRHDIQSRLDELLSEVDRLRRALAALTSRDGSESSHDGTSSETGTPAAAKTSTSAKSRSRANAGAATRSAGSAARKAAAAAPATVRTAPGATKAAVLAALADGKAMTAGEIAAATGLGRATISTTLSKLAKNGEVAKADRGYRVETPAATNGAAASEADEATPSES